MKRLIVFSPIAGRFARFICSAVSQQGGKLHNALLRGVLFIGCMVPSLAFGLSVASMSVNGRNEPVGIAGTDVSLSWATESEERGMVQSAYQIRLFEADAGTPLWDSGCVTSARQIDISVPDTVTIRAATRYRWQVRVWDGKQRASDWSTPATFETGLFSVADWNGAVWIGEPAPSNPVPEALPLLRGSFDLAKEVKSARLYASAHGIYELWLNGSKVGNQYLSPGWTDYTHRIQSQTYDVTSLLKAGPNVVGAALGDGWYRGNVGMRWHNVYGDTLALITMIRVVYTDGSTGTFVSDGTWRTHAGPFLQADLQDGETYDARLAQTGWNLPGFDASGWSPVRVVPDDLTLLVPQPDAPVRATGTLTAQTRTEPVQGRAVYDLGQNMVGVVRVRITGRRGQTVQIRYAEELYRKGEHKGELYTDNFRQAKVVDHYIFANDGVVQYQPTFTQHGFRYVEISGVDMPPEPADVEGVVLGSDLSDIGDLRLSDPMLDQLVRNIRWGQRGNFLSIPTDTPARDERLGWTGDINVFAPTACRYQDTRAFLSKWMADMRDAQKENGNIPAVVPQPRQEFDQTGVGWSDAFISVPYAVWQASSDVQIVRENWEAMNRFYRFVRTSATEDGNLLEEGRSSWFSGDWLHLEDVDRMEEHKVIATAYFAMDTRMMAEMAAALGFADRAEELKALAIRIQDAFAKAYCDQNGRIYTGTQTVYSMALGMNLITEPELRRKVVDRFVEKLASDAYHLRTGFLGTPWLLPALSNAGRYDLAMRLLNNDTYPSWGFEVKMGATTMWERWNSIQPDGSFGAVEMNSFNHYAYGAVADWMFARLGGLQALAPGYARCRIAPGITWSGLRYGQVKQYTPFGLLSSKWSVDDGILTLDVTIAANTEGEVLIPTASPETVMEGTQGAISAQGVISHTFEDGILTLRMGSGTYHFHCPFSAPTDIR